ncbi:MAG: SCO family protein [Candidatus Eremiobacteraeota bacterium]|nr:SCO family protein [Candidatus Eremiobacteraeota bacterium]
MTERIADPAEASYTRREPMRTPRSILALLAIAFVGGTSAVAARVPESIPAHGTVLRPPGPDGVTIIRNDAVTETLSAQTRAYRVRPALLLSVGEGVDGFIDRSTHPWSWYGAAVAGRFAPGVPDRGRVEPIDYGSNLPATQLVDQRGRVVNLATDFSGKVTLVSFIFTRCPDKDQCPAISAKFGYFQQHLDPARFHLVEISLDPVYDSPRVLLRYGKQFGADARAWSLVTGQQSQVQHLLNRFGISSLRISEAAFIHDDKVFVADQHGKIADIVNTAGFAPDSLVAEVQHIAGMNANPFGRLRLALVASATALCGGSQFAGIVLLETLLFMLIASIAFVILGYVARALWKRA